MIYDLIAYKKYLGTSLESRLNEINPLRGGKTVKQEARISGKSVTKEESETKVAEDRKRKNAQVLKSYRIK